jgi:hypothetical protein
MASYSSFAITMSDKDHEVWFFLQKNHDKVNRFGPHQSRTALTLPGCLRTESLLLLNRNDILVNDELPQEMRPSERNL